MRTVFPSGLAFTLYSANFVVLLFFVMDCNLLTAAPLPRENRSQPIPQDIIAKWEKVGAFLRGVVFDEADFWHFSNERVVADSLPVFSFSSGGQQWDKFAPVPVPFGLLLGNHCTDADLNSQPLMSRASRLYLPKLRSSYRCWIKGSRRSRAPFLFRFELHEGCRRGDDRIKTIRTPCGT
jgi:hypothetical protein